MRAAAASTGGTLASDCAIASASRAWRSSSVAFWLLLLISAKRAATSRPGFLLLVAGSLRASDRASSGRGTRFIAHAQAVVGRRHGLQQGALRRRVTTQRTLHPRHAAIQDLARRHFLAEGLLQFAALEQVDHEVVELLGLLGSRPASVRSSWSGDWPRMHRSRPRSRTQPPTPAGCGARIYGSGTSRVRGALRPVGYRGTVADHRPRRVATNSDRRKCSVQRLQHDDVEIARQVTQAPPLDPVSARRHP